MGKNAKVTFVVHRVYPPYFGGDEVQTMDTARELVRHGIKATIFSADFARGLDRNMCCAGVEINRFQSTRPYYISIPLFRAIWNAKTDILHSFTFGDFGTFATAICKAKNRGVKVVLQPHYHGAGRNALNNSVIKIYNPTVGKWIFKNADKIRCLSESEKKLVINHFGVSPSKIAVIPFGLDTKKLNGFRNQFKRGHTEHRVLYVGQLEEFKGVHLLVRAFARLLESFPRAYLRIVGDGSQKLSLVALTKKLKIEHKVTFLSKLPEEDLYREYCEADVFVLLSKLESYSIVVREALFFNLPVIVLENDVFEDLIARGHCFSIPQPVDVDLLANMMKKCIQGELKPERFKPIDISETVKELIRLYNEIA